LLRTQRGAPIELAQLGTRLAWESLPGNADAASAQVVLMNRSFAFRLPRPTGAGSQLPRAVQGRLSQNNRLGGVQRTYYYIECRVDGRAWRSQVDWFVAADV
jgi:hypothetical protein